MKSDKKRLLIILLCSLLVLGTCATGIYIFSRESEVVVEKPETVEDYIDIMNDAVESKDSSLYYGTEYIYGSREIGAQPDFKSYDGIVSNGQAKVSGFKKDGKSSEKAEYSEEYDIAFNSAEDAVDKNSTEDNVLDLSPIIPNDCTIEDNGLLLTCKVLQDFGDDEYYDKNITVYTLKYNEKYELKELYSYSRNYRILKSIADEFFTERILEKSLIEYDLDIIDSAMKYKYIPVDSMPVIIDTDFSILYGVVSKEKEHLKIIKDTVASDKQGDLIGSTDSYIIEEMETFDLHIEEKGVVANNQVDLELEYSYGDEPSYFTKEVLTTLYDFEKNGYVQADGTFLLVNSFKEEECKYDSKSLKLVCNKYSVFETTHKSRSVASADGYKYKYEFKFDKNGSLENVSMKFEYLNIYDNRSDDVDIDVDKMITDINAFLREDSVENKQRDDIEVEQLKEEGYLISYNYMEEEVQYK